MFLPSESTHGTGLCPGTQEWRPTSLWPPQPHPQRQPWRGPYCHPKENIPLIETRGLPALWGASWGKEKGCRDRWASMGPSASQLPVLGGPGYTFTWGDQPRAGGRRNPVHWILSRDLGVGDSGVQSGPSSELDSRGCRTKLAPLI